MVLGDGSVWMWGIADSQCAGATQILDWYHARSYLWAAAHAIWPADETHRAQWARTQVTALWESQVDAVLAELEQHRGCGEAVERTIT